MNTENFIKHISSYTMTSKERMESLFHSLEYIRTNNIDGDYVECGVWKGGNIIGILLYLEHFLIFDKNIWLYDTFNGMSDPEDVDIDLDTNKAADLIKLDNIKCRSSLEEVKNNINELTKYPKYKIKYIIGDVCDTLLNLNNIPEKISLLRLDTDWYKSTKIELDILWDKLVNNGVLIIDDYGHWKGCKKAVDEFFKDKNYKFENIDYTAIRIIK